MHKIEHLSEQPACFTTFTCTNKPTFAWVREFARVLKVVDEKGRSQRTKLKNSIKSPHFSRALMFSLIGLHPHIPTMQCVYSVSLTGRVQVIFKESKKPKMTPPWKAWNDIVPLLTWYIDAKICHILNYTCRLSVIKVDVIYLCQQGRDVAVEAWSGHDFHRNSHLPGPAKGPQEPYYWDSRKVTTRALWIRCPSCDSVKLDICF